MNNDDPIQSDVEIVGEKKVAVEPGSENTTSVETSSSISILSTNAVEKKSYYSRDSKRYCKFNRDWAKIPKYASFLQECRTNSSLAHCSICKSNFSVANGGKYLIDRHVEQAGHKRLAEMEAKQKCNLVC
jgi:hypothetical protein